jgi:ParB-like chromosome segregation protein Spo0J
VSLDHVRRLAASIACGRLNPLLDVEPHPVDGARYRIVCGEQRWRAAREAGFAEVLVRVVPPLTYLDRLQRQYEENRMRLDLDPIEEAHTILLDRDLRAAASAERILADSGVPFTPLSRKTIQRREEFRDHLEGLLALMEEHRLRRAGADISRLAPWRETERALGLSETARKVRVGLLRISPAARERVGRLPLEHAALVSRIPDEEAQLDIAVAAEGLRHEELRALISRRTCAQDSDPASPGPLAFEVQLARIAELCRQLLRAVGNLAPEVSAEEQERLVAVLSAVAERCQELRSA